MTEMITAARLALLTGSKPSKNLDSVHAGLVSYGKRAGLDKPHRLAAYLANLVVESGNFKYDRELWGPTPAQERYDIRTDLGNTPERDGDGFKNRGRGPIQITGGYNIKAFEEWCRKKFGEAPDFTANPDLICTDPWEGLSAIWFWDTNHLNKTADAFDFNATVRGINGGYNHIVQRRKALVSIGMNLLGYPANSPVSRFQTAMDLTSDNIPGPVTCKAMLRKLSGLPEVVFSAFPEVKPASKSFIEILLEALLTMFGRKS